MTGSALFALYRGVTALAEPAGRPFLAWRRRRGKEDPNRWPERLGHPARARPPGRLVWLHGASVGEGVSLLPLVEALVARRCGVLVTTGTVNAARVLAARLPAGAIHQFAPLDLPGAVRRFLAAWRPDLAVLAESELWPNTVQALARAGIPLALVNARMSARSARRWSKAPGFIGALLGRTALCLCQTAEDAARYAALGALRTEVAGQLKFDVAAPAADPADVSAFRGRVGARALWIAASVHADEEAALIEAHVALMSRLPGALAILIPRQPERGTAIREAASRRGLAAALRSRGEPLEPRTALYVADTMGELGLFYRLGGAVFMGKSLVEPGGGQNPIEPAKLGCAVLHGPHVANFADVFAALDAAGGALRVAGGEDLAAVLASLLPDATRLAATAAAGAAVVTERSGATARILAALAPLLGDTV